MILTGFKWASWMAPALIVAAVLIGWLIVLTLNRGIEEARQRPREPEDGDRPFVPPVTLGETRPPPPGGPRHAPMLCDCKQPAVARGATLDGPVSCVLCGRRIARHRRRRMATQ